MDNKDKLFNKEEIAEPLVSIIVITYNSSEFVLETLESAKAQTYQNIELIISDDCSKDNTVEICKKWLEINKEQFVRTELITVSENTGIPANCNRGIKASKGEWVKFIAGDDYLHNNAIENFVLFSNNNSDSCLVHSDYYRVKNQNVIENNTDCKKEWRINFFLDNNTTQSVQNKILHYICPVAAPTVFIKRNIILNVGAFDESIRLMEDMPMWLKLSNAGYKFYYLNKKTIYYRIHQNSASNADKKKLFNINQTRSTKLLYDKYTKGAYSFKGKIYRMLFFKVQFLLESIGLNSRNIVSISIYEFFRRLVDNYKMKKIIELENEESRHSFDAKG